MTVPVLVVGLSCALALIAGGAVTAFAAGNAIKKLAGVLVALVGAALVLGVVGAPSVAIVAAVAIALGYATIGVSLAVRAQEVYGVIEEHDLDAADAQQESPESES